MTRQEMIDILILDKEQLWLKAKRTQSLELLLQHGFKGYENYSDEELLNEIEDTLTKERLSFLTDCSKLLKFDREEGNLA